MKISLNWINDYLDINKEDYKQLASKITDNGVNVESITKFEIDKLIVGKVIKKEQHPEADKLSVCVVDVGREKLQIICGASNVDVNQKVVVALEGCLLPNGLKIKKTTIRNIESQGMICSLEELKLEESSKGIHVLDKEALVGDDPKKYLYLDDIVYNLDLNPNRNDCLSYLGFAYEVGIVLNKEVKMPEDTYQEIDEEIISLMKLNVETENASKYEMKIVKEVTIKESPEFIKQRLFSSGLRPINNVVDISNYVMLEYGQPLHFFDLDKLGNEISVEMATEEEIETLDKQLRQLTNEDIVIKSNNQVVAIAGVMGALNSDIDSKTTNILIESAIFNPFNVRQTSLRLNLRSEASLRFEKGLNPEYTSLALKRACYLLEKYANAKIVKGHLSHDCSSSKKLEVEVTLNKINDVLGTTLVLEDVKSVLKKLNFPYQVTDNNFLVEIPKRRLDISIKEDLIEEIGRIYGYDKIPTQLPKGVLKEGKYDDFLKFKKDISKRLRSLGLNEVKTYTLINEKNIKNFNQDHTKLIPVKRPISKEHHYLRDSLLYSLKEVMDYNFARQLKNVNIYELSNVYTNINNQYQEETKLAILVTGDYLNNDLNKIKIKYDFYLLKGILENLLNYLGFDTRYQFVSKELDIKELHPYQSAVIKLDKEEIGYLGKLHPNYEKEDVFVLELNLSKLYLKKVRPIKYQEINKYPSIAKDFAFWFIEYPEIETIISFIKRKGGDKLVKVEVFDIYKEKDKTSIAFSLLFEDYERTLTDKEVMAIFNKLITEIETNYQATLRNN